jgi:hypothetical protein
MCFIMNLISNEYEHGVIRVVMEVNLLIFGYHPKTDDYLDNIIFKWFLPVITKLNMRSAVSYISRITSQSY